MNNVERRDVARPSKHAVVDGTLSCVLLSLMAAPVIGVVLFSLTFLLTNTTNG